MAQISKQETSEEAKEARQTRPSLDQRMRKSLFSLLYGND